MRASGIVVHLGAPGCAELGDRGLVDTSACCEACHSAEGYSPGFMLGPCRVVLPGGEQTFVCCRTRRQLLRDRQDGREAKEMIGT